jgi:hypothetical protein
MSRGVLGETTVENVIEIAAPAERCSTSWSMYGMSRSGIPRCCMRKC